MQAYQQKVEKFFVSEEKSFIGSATGIYYIPWHGKKFLPKTQDTSLFAQNTQKLYSLH